MSPDWLSKLARQKEALKARLHELLRKTGCTAYLDLGDEKLDQALEKHFSDILLAVETGSMQDLLEEVARRAEMRAEDPQFRLRHTIALFLLTRQVFREMVAGSLPPEDHLGAMTRIGAVVDAATLVAADAFSTSRQAIIIRQQGELANMAEIIREEIDGLDRNISKSSSNVERMVTELHELQDYRNALIERIVAIQNGWSAR